MQRVAWRAADQADLLFSSRTIRFLPAQAYHNRDAVTDELVDAILKPGLQPGAAQVFLDFISYSSGPLAEDLLPQLERAKCPVLIAWGEKARARADTRTHAHARAGKQR